VTSPASVRAQLSALRTRLEELQPGLIAVSGGVDSRLLLHAARLWGLSFTAVHAAGPHQSAMEQKLTLSRLNDQQGSTLVIPFDPMALPEVRANSRQRCYWCKLALFRQLRDLADQHALRSVLEGTQVDDLHGHRPGYAALQELGVLSPFVHVGMHKADIRKAAVMLDLGEPQQPSRACLLTRFPYEHAVSRSALEAVGRVEDSLTSLGLRSFRFRLTGKKANLLQLHPQDHPLWQRRQSEARTVIKAEGLAPFDVSVTEKLSGYFDDPRH
jgi:pyridinium-3,5-biscarboxylic acid mononucleotide sulfurtransferase